MPRTARTGGQPHRLRDGQPEREKRRKRGACIDPSGYDAGKKIKGKKRHVLVDTLGLLLHAVIHPADIQDRDGGVLVLSTLFGMYPFLLKLFVDGGYQGPQFHSAAAAIMMITSGSPAESSAGQSLSTPKWEKSRPAK